jgi:hypothetical protein
MATSALQNLTFGVVDSKKSERGYAGIGLLALLGLGAGAAIWASRRGGRPAPPPPQAVEPAYGAYSYTIGSNRADVNGLTDILRRELGDQTLAMWVYDLNRDVLPTNINLIEQGMVIQIPTRQSVAAAPPEALADFRRRYDLLVELFKSQCTPGSIRGGRGVKNCSSKREGILPIGPNDPILQPTVTPDREASRVAAAARQAAPGGAPVTSSFSFANRLSTIDGLTARLDRLSYGGGGISTRMAQLTSDAGISRIGA